MIYKYRIGTYGMAPARVTVAMPPGAQILTFGLQEDSLMVWANVDPYSGDSDLRDFYIAFTGSDVPDGATYIGSIITPLVYHIFVL
jgi:hypothetical protein